MEQSREEWRFMRKRAEQLYEEGEVRCALRMMARINLAQENAFRHRTDEMSMNHGKKIVSTH